MIPAGPKRSIVWPTSEKGRSPSSPAEGRPFGPGSFLAFFRCASAPSLGPEHRTWPNVNQIGLPVKAGFAVRQTGRSPRNLFAVRSGQLFLRPNIELSCPADHRTATIVHSQGGDTSIRHPRGQLLRVALGGYPPKAPTVPHERISRMLCGAPHNMRYVANSLMWRCDQIPLILAHFHGLWAT